MIKVQIQPSRCRTWKVPLIKQPRNCWRATYSFRLLDKRIRRLVASSIAEACLERQKPLSEIISTTKEMENHIMKESRANNEGMRARLDHDK